MQLATIGYEGATLADFVATLKAAGVEQVLDVRELPQSRRPGFSKNGLRFALSEAGISYEHLRQLGDPKHGREAARAGNYDLFRSIFTAHMETPASQEALSEAVKLTLQKSSALVCYERNPKECHRTIVADRISSQNALRVIHLGVRAGSGQGRGFDGGNADRFDGACQ